MAGFALVRRPDRLPIPAAALAVWSLVVWGGRLRNLIAETGSLGDLRGAERWSFVGAVTFGLLALATLVALAVNRRLAVVPVAGLALLTVVVWAYRAVVIAGRDYDAGFIAVHTVLAVVSIALGAWCLQALARSQPSAAAG